MGILSFLTNPQGAMTDMAEDAVSGAASVGKGFLSSLLSIPGRIFGSLWNGVKYTAILLGVQTLGAPLYNAAYGAIFGQEALTKLMQRRKKDAPLGTVIDAAETGFGTAAALAAAGGVADALGGGIIGTAGAGLAIAAGAAVAMGAVHINGVNVASNEGNTAQPPATPGAKPKAPPAKS